MAATHPRELHRSAQRASDPAERQAERVAARLLSPSAGAGLHCTACSARSAPCPACAAGAEAALGPALGHSVASGPAMPPGAPLPQALRARFEQRLGTALPEIRLQRGPGPARSARSEGSRGYALGRHIVLGAEAPASESPEGEHLIAHEVGHVLSGHTGVQRENGPRPPPDLTTLSNADFLIELQTAQEPTTSDERRRAVEAERRRRVALGHEWLTPGLAATPGEFYRLLAGGGVEAVLLADPALALGPPIDLQGSPILSSSQFQQRLTERAIPTIAASMLGPAAGGAVPPPLELPTVRPPSGRGAVPYLIVDPATAPAANLHLIEVHVPTAEHLGGPRIMGEPIYDLPPALAARIQAGETLTVQELNSLLAMQHNARVNYRVAFGFEHGQPLGLGTDTFTGRAGESASRGYVYAAEGSGGVGQAMLGERAVRALRSGVELMALEVGTSQRAVPGAAPGAPTAVERFHAELHQLLGRSGAPPTAGQHYSLNRREMARLALALHAAATPEETTLLARIAGGDQGAIAQLRALPPPNIEALAYRAMLESLARSGFRNQLLARTASPLTPEWGAAQRYGPWGAGARATGMGSGLGALMALGFDASSVAINGGDWGAFADRAPQTLTLGGVGGGVSVGLEQALVNRTSSTLMGQALVPGLGTGLRLVGTRLVSGGAGAGVAELVLIYGFEDRPHSTGEVVGRTARSTGIGMVSAGAGTLASAATTSLIGAILSTGGAGAAGGSVVPGWGTAIGFVVGVGAGVLTYVVLDQALPRVEPTPP